MATDREELDVKIPSEDEAGRVLRDAGAHEVKRGSVSAVGEVVE